MFHRFAIVTTFSLKKHIDFVKQQNMSLER